MASKTYLKEQIDKLEKQKAKLEAELKRQKDGNFLLKRRNDALIFQVANLTKERDRLRKKPWYKRWFTI